MSGSRADRRAAVQASGLLAVGLLGLSVLAVSPARAADDGYASVFSSVLGSVGLVKGDTPPPIEYRERPPLVLPKDAALPKPVAGEVKHAASWPQDPDKLRRRKEAEDARAPHIMNPDMTDRGVILSKDELLKGRAAEQEPVRPNECGNEGQHCLLLSPAQLKAESEHYRATNPDKADTLVAGQEPERVFLTQPPKGYMKPVKNVKATAEAPQEKLDDGSARYMQQQEARKKAAEE